MKRLFYVILGFAMTFGLYVNAQGNIHVQGEGGVFTPERLALLKSDRGELGGIGNNPAMMNLYSDMRMKFGRMGEEVNLTLDDIDGTIYPNEDFVLGALYEDGVAFKRLYLRYDAYNDEVELKESADSEVVRAMVKHPKYSCSIGNDKFVYTDYQNEDGESVSGYLKPLVYGDGYVLYEKQIKVFKEGKPAKTSLDNSFPHRFLDKTEYYVSAGGEAPIFMKTKKSDVLSLFPEDQYSVMKEYMKGKRIDFDDSRDLMNLFAYANTL
ncbi:hypothetical protein J0X14_05375 [Muricauda sp. CAU 1633]|uniref:hypothetical protein n=1 Tax=Allomuricauda sp. CAU 1633 TaxID=2816036 RepID=UPI001A8D301E|nr:hypothetical protein [Muricauda sp. CAU 1633]MBO0321717.1 hypothetical protein [Muricauda sp. CAU 1633]